MEHFGVGEKEMEERLRARLLQFRVLQRGRLAHISLLLSHLQHNFKMLTLLCIVLLTSHVLSADQSLKCNERTEYAENQQCCKKCKPGQFMDEKCGTSSRDTQCKPCGNGFFTNEYNIKYKYCSPCTKCTKEHMRYKRTCTTTGDAECTCEDGYKCSSNKCERCDIVLKTTPPTKIPPVTNVMPFDNRLTTGYNCHDSKCRMRFQKTTTSPPATNDNVWISVSGTIRRATLYPVSAQRKKRSQCQCRRCVGRPRNWRMSERGERRPLVRLSIEYLL
ncbi:uncharacterized protein isoform X2 [Danio rerio]|uniref:Uncharacterized protein isoform X2 n=1 Tax=Danio rerio TaxID=7955 RepID=A0AC58HJE8_DANRE